MLIKGTKSTDDGKTQQTWDLFPYNKAEKKIVYCVSETYSTPFDEIG